MLRAAVAVGAAALALWAGSAPSASACPMCFGQADGPMADATRLGLWLLLGITGCLQGAFVAFFLYLRRQGARAANRALDDEWSALQTEWDAAGRSGSR